MIAAILGLIVGILPVILGSPPEIFHPKVTSGFRPFSSVEQTSGTKLSPNGAAVKQWETRSWIQTIPLQKAVNHKTESESKVHHHHHHRESSLTTTSSPSEDSYDYHQPPSSSHQHHPHGKYLTQPFHELSDPRDPRDPRNYPIISSSVNITHRPLPSDSRSHDHEIESPCRGETCRKSPFQGTYDTMNYQKKMVYPDKHSIRIPQSPVDESGYTQQFRSHSEDDYSGDESDRHGNNGDDVAPVTRSTLPWHHHSISPSSSPSTSPPLRGRSNQWESDTDSGSDADWNNKKEWKDRLSSPRDSTKKSFRHSETSEPPEETESWSEPKRRRKIAKSDETSRPKSSRYEYDRQEYDKEKDRKWRSYSRSHEYPPEEGKWRSSEEQHEQNRPEKQSNRSEEGRRKKKEKSKPKIRTYHHDEDTPDGYSHAHGYEKEEVEGTRFFEPAGLTSFDDPEHEEIPRGRSRFRKSKGECDCSGRSKSSRLIDDLEEKAKSKAAAASSAAAASAARVKRAGAGQETLENRESRLHYSLENLKRLTKSFPSDLLKMKSYSNNTLNGQSIVKT